MNTLGLKIDEDLVFIKLPYLLQTGRKVAQKLLERGIDAVFSANNVLLMGVRQYFSEHNVSVPREVSVIGFDDYDRMNIAP